MFSLCSKTLAVFLVIDNITGFSMQNNHVFHKFDKSSIGIVRVTQVVRAASKLGCSNECACRKCNGFFWFPTSKQCRLMEHDYIENLQPETKQNVFYYKQSGNVTSQLPWLFCPTRRSGVTAAITKHKEFKFFIHTNSVTYDEARSSCNRNGDRLMKITNANKHKVVSKILSGCSDFVNHDFWINGKKHEHSGWQFSDGSHIPFNGSHLRAPHAPNSHCESCCIRLSSAHEYKRTAHACRDKVSGYICDIV